MAFCSERAGDYQGVCMQLVGPSAILLPNPDSGGEGERLRRQARSPVASEAPASSTGMASSSRLPLTLLGPDADSKEEHSPTFRLASTRLGLQASAGGNPAQ